LPTRERLDRLRRSYGDALIDELSAELQEMNLYLGYGHYYYYYYYCYYY
jgi:hypothetical protein